MIQTVAFGLHLFEHLKTAGFHFKTELVDEELTDQLHKTNDINSSCSPDFQAYRNRM